MLAVIFSPLFSASLFLSTSWRGACLPAGQFNHVLRGRRFDDINAPDIFHFSFVIYTASISLHFARHILRSTFHGRWINSSFDGLNDKSYIGHREGTSHHHHPHPSIHSLSFPSHDLCPSVWHDGSIISHSLPSPIVPHSSSISVSGRWMPLRLRRPVSHCLVWE